MRKPSGFKTEHGHFQEGEEAIYIDPNGNKHQGTIAMVYQDGDVDFVGDEWSRGGTFKWRYFRKLSKP